ncbi:MAG: FxsA family protein [Rhodobacteraceae bacterium]|nr:FxsA family protein [Paracoccaceae bacterium]
MPLLLAFIIVPLIEIALFVQVGGAIGLWPTLAIVLLTALVGSTLIRAQGAEAIARVQAALSRGDDPSRVLVHGALILFAGALLLTPGFFTDVVGLALLLPVVRERAIDAGGAWIARRMAAKMAASQPHPRRGPDTIETDYTVIDDDTPPRPPGQGGGDSPWRGG